LLGRYVDLGNPVADHPLNRGLLAWWMALPNNAGGGTLFDLTRRYPGTLTNAPVWSGTSRPGSPCRGITFTAASTQYVLEGSNSTGLQPANVTLAIWVKATTWSIYRDICGNAANSWGRGYFLGVGMVDAGNIGFGCRGQSVPGGYQNAARISSASVPLGTWVHLAGTYDGTTTAFYVNGALAHSVSGGSAAAGDLGYDGLVGGLAIGRNYAADKYFDGQADGLTVHNRALSAAEVFALYADSASGHPDTLRRWSRRWRAVDVPAAAGGGGSSLAANYYYSQVYGGGTF
jgi:hypothetical protein